MKIGPRTALFHSPDSHTLWDRRINGVTFRFMVVYDGEGEVRAAVWRVERWNSVIPVHQWRH